MSDDIWKTTAEQPPHTVANHWHAQICTGLVKSRPKLTTGSTVPTGRQDAPAPYPQSLPVCGNPSGLLSPVLHVDGQHYVALAAANPNGNSHVRMLGNNVFSVEAGELDSTENFTSQGRLLTTGNSSDGVEGINQNSDSDFNNLIVTVNFSLQQMI